MRSRGVGRRIIHLHVVVDKNVTHHARSDLALDGGALYDPQANYDRVRGKIFDWDDDKDPAAQSTRTVDTPAQDGSIPGQ